MKATKPTRKGSNWPPTDWAAMIRQMQGQGMSLRAIAVRLGISKSAVGDLATGKSSEPAGWAAVRLYKAHCQATVASLRIEPPAPGT